MFMPRCTRGPVQGIRWPASYPIPAATVEITPPSAGIILPPHPSPRYIPSMPDETCYIVSILEPVGGKLGWRTLLNTKDLEEANALISALEADGAKCRYEVILPRKKR